MNNGQQVYSKLAYRNIASGTTTVVKASAAILKHIVVGTGVDGATITIYDALTATGTPVSIVTLTSDVPGFLAFDVGLLVGLTVVTSGATNLTVVFQ